MGIVWDDQNPPSPATTIAWDDGQQSSVPSSAIGAFGRSAARAALPTLAGIGAGAVGYGLGVALAPETGGLSLLIPAATGLLAGMGGQRIGSMAQEGALSTFLPKQTHRLNAQQASDIQTHPVASFAGQFAPQALALRPSLSAPLAMKALGGGIGAGTEAIGEAVRHEPLNPTKIAISGTAGALLNKPTALGQRLGLPTLPETSQSVASVPENPRVQKLIGALQEAKPVRGQQEALYAQARSQQLARVLDVRGTVGGESGYHAELGQLKGPLPKAQFEGIRQRVGQSDIDGLFNDINASSALGPWEKLTAKAGLSKLLQPTGGSVPTRGELDALHQIFGPQLTQTLLNKRPLLTRMAALGTEIANVPRALMASLDMSAPLRQGAFLIGRPRQWFPAFGSMVHQFFSEKTYQASQQEIVQRSTYSLMRQAKLAITDTGPMLANREEAFMSRLVERVPGVRASNRAYVGFLNRLRADVFDDLIRKGQTLGISDDPHFLASVGSFVNAATGRGPLGPFERSAVPLSNIFFSPRLMASRIALLNPVYYLGLEPTVRREALQSLLTFAGTGMTILSLAKLNGAQIGVDPRSADFGKIKIGDTRYDPWAGFQQYIRAASQVITGQYISTTTGREMTLGEGYGSMTRKDIAQRLLESKTSPIVSFALALLQGKTATGDQVRIGPEIADRFIPMVIQDAYDLIRERGATLGITMALPGIVGVGVQTYGPQVPQLTKTPMGKPSISFRQSPSLGETLINQVTGAQVSNIPQTQHAALIRARQAEIQRKIELEKVKQAVLHDGRPRRVGNTRVYLQRGMVKVHTVGRAQTPIRTYQSLNKK